MIVRAMSIVILVVLANCVGQPIDVSGAADETGDVVPESAWYTARFAEGRAVYEKSCAACHDPGASDAPAIGVSEDWDDRSRLWVAVLFEHAQAGYLEMPARGDAPGLSDEEVSDAAEYMLTVTYPELPVD